MPSSNLINNAETAKASCLAEFIFSLLEWNSTHFWEPQAGIFRRICSISFLPNFLARSSGVLPRLKANLSPKIRNEWGGVTSSSWLSNLCFRSFPKWNLLNVEQETKLLSGFCRPLLQCEMKTIELGAGRCQDCNILRRQNAKLRFRITLSYCCLTHLWCMFFDTREKSSIRSAELDFSRLHRHSAPGLIPFLLMSSWIKDEHCQSQSR